MFRERWVEGALKKNRTLEKGGEREKRGIGCTSGETERVWCK